MRTPIEYRKSMASLSMGRGSGENVIAVASLATPLHRLNRVRPWRFIQLSTPQRNLPVLEVPAHWSCPCALESLACRRSSIEDALVVVLGGRRRWMSLHANLPHVHYIADISCREHTVVETFGLRTHWHPKSLIFHL